MASYSKLSDLFPIQSQLDYALEDATTQEEKENLVHQYLHKIDEKDDLIILDFEEGKSVNELSGWENVYSIGISWEWLWNLRSIISWLNQLIRGLDKRLTLWNVTSPLQIASVCYLTLLLYNVVLNQQWVLYTVVLILEGYYVLFRFVSALPFF